MAPTHQADWSPSDWPETLQELRRIDNLLRCSICYEYFDTAVLFQECSHNYCSLCIRRAMVYDPQCPTCFEKTSGNDLKCNRVLDELVKNFVNVRPKLLDLINKALTVQSIPEKKDNIVEMSDDSASNFEVTPRRLRMHLKSRTKKGKSPSKTPRNKRKRPRLLDSDSDDNDSEDVKESQAMDIDPLKSPAAHTSQAPDDAAAPTSFVECPVCGELISSNTINTHLDLCLISGEKKSSLRSRKKATDTNQNVTVKQEPDAASTSMKSSLRLGSQSSSSTSHDNVNKKIAGANTFISSGPKRKPIPGIVYAILSDKQLKQKLKEWNLSTQGNRKTLIKRHQEFVVAYNAQCDSVNPKPVSAIIKELEIKEKRKTTNLKMSNSTSTGPNLNVNRDASEEQVDRVHKKYLQENKSQFEKLIEEVKKRKKQGSTSNDKTTRSVVIIDDESKQEDTTESENTDQLQPRNQESNNDTSGDSSSKIRIKKHKFSFKSSSSDLSSQQNDVETSKDKNVNQFQTEDPRNQNCSDSSTDTSRRDKKCLVFQGSEKSENQVPEPPVMSNLGSINESDSCNEDSVDDKDNNTNDDDGNDDDNNDDDNDDDNDDYKDNDDDNDNEEEDNDNDDDNGNDNDDNGNGEDDDDDDDGNDSDETKDDIKSDQDWDMTPSFGIASSDEEYNEDENGESDEDLFEVTPRQSSKRRSLRRKK